jgi:hypothetical protein
MIRSRLSTWWRPSLVLALLAQGCTLDYNGLATTEAASGAATTASSSGSGSAAGTTVSSSQATTGPGGGDGGAPAGPGSGGAGGATGSGGEGGTLPCCVDATDCDDDNPCTDDACTDTCCSNQPVSDGPLGADDPSDCITRSCEGGQPVEEPDVDDDPPDTSPPCDVTTCVEGVPTRVLAPLGTSCGDDPLECDGSGVCVGCDADPADQCGAPTACATPVCNVDTQICDPGFVSGPLDDPTPEDCLGLECSGDLADASVVPNDADPPPPLPCSLRGCSGGEITTPVLAEGEPCLGGETGVCDGVGTEADACVDCRDTKTGGTIDDGCNADAPICDETGNGGDGVCLECVDDLPGDGQDSGCDTGEVCDGTTCRDCYMLGNETSVGCGSLVCDEAADACVLCVDLGDGEADPGCSGTTPACTATPSCVECQHDDDCLDFNRPNGERCNRNNGTSCGCGGDGDCNTSPQGTHCRTNISRCGCEDADDCDHDGTNGLTCLGNGVCG